FWIWAPAAVAPIASIVVTLEVPTLSIDVIHERVGAPSICTVQAPHNAMPQPNLVPVMPSTSRNTHRSGVSPSTSTLCVLPLTLMAKAMESSPLSFEDDPARCLSCGQPAFIRSTTARQRSFIGIISSSYDGRAGASRQVPPCERLNAFPVPAR